ncbi:unnamed protein product [Candida verbasci]|uniref:Aminotransferase class I/classII large domain-containing protein n=1 Tax=Candida verbasci TaxID=1227364 RepID=A0A9W4XBG7_9ASCO|nr:unnamed protein product [Candida verbasci]
MTIESKFSKLEGEAPDPIIKTMAKFAADQSSNKIDVSIGVYKDEKLQPYLFPSIKKSKQILFENDPGHNYTSMGGIPQFINGAQRVIFGDDISNIASLQCISGTGSIHMALVFLKENQFINYYIGLPTWQNYGPMIEHIGGKLNYYKYYDEKTKKIDFESVLNTLESASPNSIFLFQTCCHNPTGSDFSQNQWTEIFKIMKLKQLIPIFDTAYQGFSSGDLTIDAWPIRYFKSQGLEFLVTQSFSKNMGLYSERVGCLHVNYQDETMKDKIQSTLVKIFRVECSFAPAYGSRIAINIFENQKLYKQWEIDISNITKRLKGIRQKILDKFQELGTPGDWSNVITQTGLFWHSGLTPQQNDKLISKYNIYSTSMGRVNIAGLNDKNLDYFVRAIDDIVRND